MHELTTSPIYLSILSIVLIFLSINIIRLRRKKNIRLLDNGDESLKEAIRAQANFIEYSPMFLLILISLDLLGANYLLMHSLGCVFCLGRIGHAFSLLYHESRTNNFVFRVTGMAMTFTPIACGAIALLLR